MVSNLCHNELGSKEHCGEWAWTVRKVLFSPMVSRYAVCPRCISQTVRCRKLILCRDIGWRV